MLTVTPKTIGEFEIYAIEWELYDFIICQKDIKATKIGFSNDTLKFKAIQETSQCETSFKFENHDIYSENVVYDSEIMKGSL